MKNATSPHADVRKARLRLTFAYGGILVLLQVAFSIVVYALISLVVWQDVQPISDWPGINEVAHAMMFKNAMFLVVANIGGLVLVAGAASSSQRPRCGRWSKLSNCSANSRATPPTICARRSP